MPKPDTINISRATPLLRWAGGKRRLLSQILPILPPTFNRYYEPFFGGGAVFFALMPPSAFVSDCNKELMHCYTQVRDEPEKVITALSKLSNTAEDYNRIRGEIPQVGAERAARIIYLAALSFNGIYRLNNSGKFNVPYCKRPDINPCRPNQIRRVSQSLANTEIRGCDFAESLRDAQAGDLIYLDPPYTVAHGNNGFVKYNEVMFHWREQQRLACLAEELSNRGCYLVISNADHVSVRQLYIEHGFRIKTVSRNSVIAADASIRKIITECIFHNLQHVEDENHAG